MSQKDRYRGVSIHLHTHLPSLQRAVRSNLGVKTEFIKEEKRPKGWTGVAITASTDIDLVAYSLDPVTSLGTLQTNLQNQIKEKLLESQFEEPYRLCQHLELFEDPTGYKIHRVSVYGWMEIFVEPHPA